MSPLYGQGVTPSRLQSQFEETGYFLPLIPEKNPVLSWSTSEGLKADLTLEPHSGFEPGTPDMRIQPSSP